MRRPSLRLRITAVATLAVGLVLAAGAAALVVSLRATLVDQVDTQLASDTDAIVRAAQDGELDPRDGPSDRYVQVVALDGQVVGASTSADGRPLLLPPPHPWAGGPAARDTDHTDPVLGPLRVRVSPFGPRDGVWLVVARSRQPVDDATRSVTGALALAVPLATVGIGAVVWLVVGRSLRPVEALRRAVDDITEHDLGRRLDGPGTGDELDRLAATMNDLLARLQAASQRERQLVADASHELRSPLAAVRALVETAPDDPDEAAAHQAEARAAVARLQTLVDQLLELARHDLPVPAPTRPVDLDDLVLQHAALLRRTSALTVDTASVSGGQVLGSEEALGRVVENLVANAARHARTTVRLVLAERDDEVVLVVADDGPGIPVADRQRVFERFTRLDDARRRDRAGAGLGLAIVARIVARHGGTVVAGDDDVLDGAAVTVRLPAADGGDADDPA